MLKKIEKHYLHDCGIPNKMGNSPRKIEYKIDNLIVDIYSNASWSQCHGFEEFKKAHETYRLTRINSEFRRVILNLISVTNQQNNLGLFTGSTIAKQLNELAKLLGKLQYETGPLMQ